MSQVEAVFVYQNTRTFDADCEAAAGAKRVGLDEPIEV
jgi:hypothetical protein